MNTESVALEKKKQGKFTKTIKNLKDKVKNTDDAVKRHSDRGVVYIGHLPHGFYEDEMRAYFTQFGKVTNVRVCRSKKTGNSKGYGFVEFSDTDVAKIAAETMDNYLMFKRKLVASYVPPEKQNFRVFKGRNWLKNDLPFVRQRKQLNRLRNRNESDATHLKKCKSKMGKLQHSLKKLADLGIQHNFVPINLPSALEDTTTLIDKQKKSKKLVGTKREKVKMALKGILDDTNLVVKKKIVKKVK